MLGTGDSVLGTRDSAYQYPEPRAPSPQSMIFQNKKILILICLLVIGVIYLASDHTPHIPTAISQNRPESFATLAKQVKPFVVNISTSKEQSNTSYHPLYGLQQSPGGKAQNSLGTGFIIDAEGHIITNNHVIEGADEIVVRFDDGQKIEAKIVGKDPKLDIAILKLVKNGSYPYVTLGDSDALEVGDWVLAVGNPFGLGHTVTAGIVSAKARQLGAGPYDDFIQTDASINPGNSGGPLFNTNGEVVGINTAIIASGQGLGFAIPINMVKDFLPQLLTQGTVSRGWLGVAIREVSQTETQSILGQTAPTGAYVVEVVPGSPADQAGIKPGAIILEFNGKNVDNSQVLPTIVAKVLPGQKSSVTFLQDGQKLTREITLGSLEKSLGSAPTATVSGILGMTVRDLSAGEKQQIRAGVVVTEVTNGSVAFSVGIHPGDLLLEINSQPIKSATELKETIAGIQMGDVIRMSLARGPHIYYFAFRKE